LTKIILYSRRTERAEAFALAFSRRVIDDYQVKDDHGEIVDRVAEQYEKYTRESSLARLRAYIARCPNPTLPFFPDGAGQYLSIIDAYWEIVRQTSLGRELLSAWDNIMDNWYQPESDRRETSHGARKRSLSYSA